MNQLFDARRLYEKELAHVEKEQSVGTNTKRPYAVKLSSRGRLSVSLGGMRSLKSTKGQRWKRRMIAFLQKRAQVVVNDCISYVIEKHWLKNPQPYIWFGDTFWSQIHSDVTRKMKHIVHPGANNLLDMVVNFPEMAHEDRYKRAQRLYTVARGRKMLERGQLRKHAVLYLIVQCLLKTSEN